MVKPIKKNNKVSVIIPCYNDGKYILDAVWSVELSSAKKFEIIVVDDGSYDKKTINVLKEIENKGYKVIKSKHKGQSSARNIGVRAAKHPYLLFLDSDNKILPEYMEKGIEILNKNPKIGVVFGDKREFGLASNEIIQSFNISENFFLNTIDTCVVVRKKAWQDCNGFDEKLDFWEDWEFFINVYRHGWKFYHIPEIMFEYRIKFNSVNVKSNVKKNRNKILQYIYKKHHPLFMDKWGDMAAGIIVHKKNREIMELTKGIQDKDFYINQLKLQLENVKRSVSWRFSQKIEKIIFFFLPKNSKLRYLYIILIRKIQNFFDKKNENEQGASSDFWTKFQGAKGNVEILFVNHEETRTGAPKILFEIAKSIKTERSIAIVSLKKGSLHGDFTREFDNIIYPEDLYDGYSKREAAKMVLHNVHPALVWVNTIAGYQYAKEAKKIGLPVIFHIHELENSFKNILNKEEIDEFKSQADIFIAVSERIKNFLFNKLGCDKNKIFVVKEFIDIKNVLAEAQKKADAEQEMNKKEGEIVVAALGTASKRKGTDIFIEAFKILNKKHCGRFKFIWIGPETESERFPFLHKKNEGFIFIGEKENPYPYLAAADIFVLPSREDPFPLVILEAAVLKKPVIAFRKGGGAEEVLKKSGVLLNSMRADFLAKAVYELAEKKSRNSGFSETIMTEVKKHDSKKALKEIKKIISFAFKRFIYKIENRKKTGEAKKISIIIPSYNYGWCITKAIDSVINQTYKNWEIIIIDDSSVDNSREIINKYIKKYPQKIKLIEKSLKDKGLAKSYQIGIKKSKGDYIAFLEADDFWREDNLAKKISIFEKYRDLVCVFSDVKIFGEEDEFLKKKIFQINCHGLKVPFKPFFMSEYIKNGSPLKTFSAAVVKNGFFEGIDFSDKYKAWFDWWFFVQLSLKGKFFFVPEKTVFWRIHKNSYNSIYTSGIDDFQQFLKMQKEMQGYLRWKQL